MNRAGDITITVDKTELIKILTANRETHHGLYEKAFEGYCKAMRAELESRLTDIKKGKAIDPHLRHLAPEDHTNDYDVVIKMMSMDLGDTVELTQSQFLCYVEDDFGWKQQWTASNTRYLGG